MGDHVGNAITLVEAQYAQAQPCCQALFFMWLLNKCSSLIYSNFRYCPTEIHSNFLQKSRITCYQCNIRWRR